MPDICPVEQALARRLEERLRDIKHDFDQRITVWQGADLPTEKSCDLILAPLLTTQNLPETLLILGKALRGDGLLLASLWGGDSLSQMRDLGVEVVPQPTIQEVGDTLTRLRFALPVMDSEPFTLTFSDTTKMSEKLVNWQLIPQALNQDLETAYRQRFPHESGHLPVTMDLFTLTAWRPHHSQPQPLKPGQFEVKIEDALADLPEKP